MSSLVLSPSALPFHSFVSIFTPATNVKEDGLTFTFAEEPLRGVGAPLGLLANKGFGLFKESPEILSDHKIASEYRPSLDVEQIPVYGLRKSTSKSLRIQSSPFSDPTSLWKSCHIPGLYFLFTRTRNSPTPPISVVRRIWKYQTL